MISWIANSCDSDAMAQSVGLLCNVVLIAERCFRHVQQNVQKVMN